MNIFGGLLGYASEPEIPQTNEERLSFALQYALGITSQWHKDGNIYIRALDGDVERIDQHVRPVFESHGFHSETKPKFARYDFDELSYEDWRAIYLASPLSAAELANRISYNMIMGKKLPLPLQRLAAFGFSGALTAPAARAVKPDQTHRDTLIAGVSKKVTERYGFKLGAAKATYLKAEKAPVRGCTIAAAALRGFGIHVAPQRADAIARRKDLPIEKAEKKFVFNFTGTIASILAVESGEEVSNPAHPDSVEMARAKTYFD